MGTACCFTVETVEVDATGQITQRRSLTIPGWQEDLGQTVLLEQVSIPAGQFLMGAPETEAGWHPSQGPLHPVAVPAFWLGRFPVTQSQWQAVAALPFVNRPLTPHPACFSEADRPVEQVSWFDAVEFCDRLAVLTGHSYRLPTEAEWEYACRAGTTTPFWPGATITTDLANYSGVDWEYNGRICSKGCYGQGPIGVDLRETTAVNQFPFANCFGLTDMHGQVREWCADVWHISYEGAPQDGSAWLTDASSPERVVRGGCWNGGPNPCRSAFRGRFDANATSYDIGFRVACTQVG
ncbi:MAG: formylglycine-generating enzyme family protein [Leptolyngbyaceae cyanobacterium]